MVGDRRSDPPLSSRAEPGDQADADGRGRKADNDRASVERVCGFRRDGGAWTGSNGSLHRSDILAVNGFDERLTYGFEDTDFGRRLELAGIARRSVRYSAVAFHLDHDRPYKDAGATARNRELMEESLRRGLARCYHGIDRLRETAEAEAWID